jgi:predicted AlkP superfamily pyrophosphatase or phosphodiesterase
MIRRIALALLLVLLAGAARAEDPVVILLSWDGVRHDYPDRTALPALGRMAAQGVRAERLVPIFPSNTFPCHVALATGTYADRHGIVDNRFLDRERGRYAYSSDASWIQAEPLWVTAERQGVRAATFFWVGSETDWHGVGASLRRAPFDADIGEAEKVEQIVAWLDLPPAERPRLVMSWWHGADGPGHRKGPDHPDVTAALREQDGQLDDPPAALDARHAWDHTTLIVVSDHGMTAVDESLDAQAPLAAAGIEAEVLPSSSFASVFLKNPGQLDRAARVLAGLDGVTVYRADELPEAWRFRHPTRTGDLVVVTSPPRTFTRPGLAESAVLAIGGLLDWRSGMHGYDPALPDMGAIFLALGRGVPAGRHLGAVRSIDVAPTVAALLGIDPPLQAEGRPLPEIAATLGADAAAAAGR